MTAQSRGLVAAAAVLLLAVFGVLAVLAPLDRAAPLAAVLVWFAIPGVIALSRLFEGHQGAGPAAWLMGPLLGHVMSSLGLLALWALGWRGGWMLVAAPVVVLPVALAFAWVRGFVRPPPLTRRDLVAALLIGAIAPAIVGRPFSQVGRSLPEGKAFRAYFTADLIWADAVTAEVAKGSLPPENPFMRGEPLTYYWLPHLVSSVEYRAGGHALTTDQILLVNGTVLGVGFAIFLYAFARCFVSSAGAAAVGCLFALLMTSFEGVAASWNLWSAGRSFEALRNVNIDGYTRWRFSSGIVDGLHRLLLYQATHHAVAYVLGALAVVACVRAVDARRAGIGLVAGVFLGLALLFSSLSAIILGAAAAAILATILTRQRAWSALAISGVAAAIPVGLSVALSSALHYVDASGGLIDLGLNRTAATRAALSLFLSFGPLVLFLVAAIIVPATRRALPTPFALIAVAMLFYFFVDVRDHAHVYVTWRAGHVVLMASAAIVGGVLEEAFRRGIRARLTAVTAAVVVGALALPTSVLDLFNAQDIANRAMGPGFRWTVLLTPGELSGLDWIRTQTRPDDIVQAEPFVRGRDSWAYVPAFAERRMAAGLPISMVPLAKYERASEAIRAIYREGDPQVAHDTAVRLGIQYLLFGVPEQRAYPHAFERWSNAPALFTPRFANGALTVFEVNNTR